MKLDEGSNSQPRGNAAERRPIHHDAPGLFQPLMPEVVLVKTNSAVLRLAMDPSTATKTTKKTR
jgi:hypothetical protein